MIYFVKRGSHRFTPNLLKLFFGKRRISVEFSFEESCLYDQGGYGQWNKLVGLSDFFTLHTSHAVRIGWRGEGYQLEIAIYANIDGEWNAKPIAKLQPNKKYKASIEIKNSSYIVNFEGKDFSLERKLKRNWGLNYLLQPYYGGQRKAPQDMQLFMRIK